MYKYYIRYNVYPVQSAPQEHSIVEDATEHIDEQAIKKILEAKHQSQVTLISWKAVDATMPANREIVGE